VRTIQSAKTAGDFRENVEKYIKLSIADKTDDVDCSVSTILYRAEGMIYFRETYGDDVAEALNIAVEMMACNFGQQSSGAPYVGDHTPYNEATILCDGGSKNNGSPDSEAYGSYRTTTSRGQITKRLRFERGLTNNQTEYRVLIAALEDLITRLHIGCEDPREWDLTVQTDSQLVIGHLVLNHKVCRGLAEYVVKAAGLLDKFHNWQLTHIPGTEVKKILGH